MEERIPDDEDDEPCTKKKKDIIKFSNYHVAGDAKATFKQTLIEVILGRYDGCVD